MTPYEYLTIFISVVLGLAVVHLLSGVALLLDTRIRARPDWIHVLWTANVLITTVLVWWFNFPLTGILVWTLPFFLNLVAYSVVLYLMSGLLYPVRGSEVIDFKAHFEGNRVRFFLVCLAFQVVDFLDAVLERQALGTDWSGIRLTVLALFAIAFVVGARTSNRTYHGVLVLAWLLTCILWGVGALDEPILAL
jgi:CHASE2 domain-containing sensor protein